MSARVIAWDAASDLAVVKLGGTGYDPAPIGSALDLSVGDPIFTLGAPTDATTAHDTPGDEGSVGALGAFILSPIGTPITDLLQLQIKQPPTQVGGGVLDSHGAVVAISTALGAPGATVEYATPMNLAQEVATELLDTGRAVPVWLGVAGTDLPVSTANALGVSGGAVVGRVYPGSPAAAAGMEVGDVVVGVDGHQVSSMAGLIMAIHAEAPQSTTELDLYRAGRQRAMSAVITARPPVVN